MQLHPPKKRIGQAHETDTQLAYTIDVVVELGPIQHTTDLIHIPSPPLYAYQFVSPTSWCQ
jgi:hypothetical protein